LRSWSHDDPSIGFHAIATNNVFYCQLTGTNKHVEITRDIDKFTYNYGTIGQKPELTFTDGQAQFFSSTGAGPSRFDYIDLNTGDHSYQIISVYKNTSTNDIISFSDPTYFLHVLKKGTQEPLFNKTCTPQSVLNLIPELDFEG
jgi:hypothetical protein